MTEWKPVKDYEGIYEVSNQGEVRRIKGGQGAQAGRLLSTKGTANRLYVSVQLCVNDEKKMHAVHRLVAEAFCKRPEGATEVNHKNCERHDNRAENLEWVTHSENMRHGYQNGAHRWKTAA